MDYYFPTAVPVSTLFENVMKRLPSFTKENTLVATSLCADEVNAPIVDAMNGMFNKPFNLGGLAGVPFVGLSGLGACLSHVPADGKLLIVIGPHIGVDKDGYIGFVDRSGQESSSTACGAVIGALKLIQSGKFDLGGDKRDAQEEYILTELSDRVPQEVLASGDEDGKIAFVTYQMYLIARDYLKEILGSMGKRPSEIAVLSGVVINRGTTGEDMFQPLLFETVDNLGETQTHFGDVFGEKPYLHPVLYNMKSVVKDVIADVNFDNKTPPPPKKILKDYFPSAISVNSLPATFEKVLPDFTKQNTLVATSICSDEINFPIVDALTSRFNQPFVLGGLAGVPFSGISGMGACISHVPTNGNLLIVLASHVGFDDKSYLGKVNRPGQDLSSGACGAAIGALKVIQATGGKTSGITTDAQEDYILTALGTRLPGKILKNKDMEAKVAFTTYQTYAVARDYLDAVLSKQKTMPKQVAVLAGVIINRGTDGEDMFQPLLFQKMDGEETTNLYNAAFGSKPFLNLLPVMGGLRDSVQDVVADLTV
jgi:hypothetical protein